MDDFDEFEFDAESENSAPHAKTLTAGSPIMIEMNDGSYVLGAMVAATLPGAVIAQTHFPLDVDQVESSDDIDKLLMSNPIETFIPYTSFIHLQSLSDLSLESMIRNFNEDLDSYGQKKKKTDDPPAEQPTMWERFIRAKINSLRVRRN